MSRVRVYVITKYCFSALLVASFFSNHRNSGFGKFPFFFTWKIISANRKRSDLNPKGHVYTNWTKLLRNSRPNERERDNNNKNIFDDASLENKKPKHRPVNHTTTTAKKIRIRRRCYCPSVVESCVCGLLLSMVARWFAIIISSETKQEKYKLKNRHIALVALSDYVFRWNRLWKLCIKLSGDEIGLRTRKCVARESENKAKTRRIYFCSQTNQTPHVHRNFASLSRARE